MMALIVVSLLAFLCLCEARPRASTDADLAIVGGQDAEPGTWPWQLSQQRYSTSWRHSCGASLLTAQYVLSAAHCVDGRPPSSLRVIAGLHNQSDHSYTQLSYLTSVKLHEEYEDGSASYSNDIAILTLETLIEISSNIQYATLPPNDDDDFAGLTCVATGWGRTSEDNNLPEILQQADMGVISNTECVTRIGSQETVWDKQICIFDNDGNTNTVVCNGDSGGPLNCPHDGGYYVAGITSWIIHSGTTCMVEYPSVYTRTSTYLQWIADNTP